MMNSGASIGFFSGNIKLLTDDMKALRPTIFAGVPRVFDKMFKKIMAGAAAASCVKAWYFNRAFEGTSDICRVAGTARDETWDTKVFIPLRERIGLDKCE